MPHRAHSRIVGTAIVVALAMAGLQPSTRACTAFCIRDGGRIVLGFNYDWMVPDGFLLANKRGITRTAMVDDVAAEWTSRYGSVSFNQYGLDFPSGGMNEAGLVVENLWLDETRYPGLDERPAVGVLGWVQFQLDTSATVAEVIASDRRIRIASPVPLHYFVADRQGHVATIEFLDGRMLVHTGKTLPAAALTNSTYNASTATLSHDPQRLDGSSLGRFATVARRIEGYLSSDEPVAYAFDTLNRAAQGNTQWNAVYEIDRARLHYRTRSDRRIRNLQLDELDFSCGTPVVGIDLHADREGDVRPHMTPFDAQQNLELIRASYGKTPFLAARTADDHRRAAEHASRARCKAIN